MRYKRFLPLLALLLAVMGGHVEAFVGRSPMNLPDPDTIAIEQVRRYTDVLVDGDALFVVHYHLDYTVLPAEPIDEGWIGRLIDVGGAGELDSATLQAHHLIPNNGYDHGVYSFYLETAPVPTGTLTVTLEGNPGLSPSPMGVTSVSIEDRTASQLTGDLRLLGLHFESQWSLTTAGTDVITFTSGPGRFTADGENYFLAAIPNLNKFAPDLFSVGTFQTDPADHIDALDATTQTAANNFWANTPVAAFTTVWSDYIGLPRVVFETILSLALAVGIAAVIYMRTQQQEIGIFAALLWLNVGAAMGLGPFQLIYMIAFTSIVSLAYMFFFRPGAA